MIVHWLANGGWTCDSGKAPMSLERPDRALPGWPGFKSIQ
jgi:hypothetical protein